VAGLTDGVRSPGSWKTLSLLFESQHKLAGLLSGKATAINGDHSWRERAGSRR
jgi:hypothetical protein